MTRDHGAECEAADAVDPLIDVFLRLHVAKAEGRAALDRAELAGDAMSRQITNGLRSLLKQIDDLLRLAKDGIRNATLADLTRLRS